MFVHCRFRPVRSRLPLLLLMPLFACGAEVAIELRPDVLLNGPQVALSDIAQVTAPDPALQRQLAGLIIGHAPLVGYVDQRSRAELDLQLRSLPLMLGQSIAWRGAALVKMRRASQMLDAGQLVEVARRYLLDHYGAALGDSEIRLDGVLPEIGVPLGELHYAAHLAAPARLHTRMPVWVEVSTSDGHSRAVVVPLLVRAQRDVYVARRELAAGSAVAAADFEVRKEDVAGLQDEALAPGSLAGGGRMRQPLAAGQIATAHQIALQDTILRGDHVRLQTAAAGIAIETGAYAQADGAVGQRIQVRPEHSNEIISARVTAPGVVSLDER